jgi:cold shock CspA family protein
MQGPVEISYRHCAPSEALNAIIKEKAAELQRFYARIRRCQVTIETPSAHHRQGDGAHFRVRVELGVPGRNLVTSRHPAARIAKEDAFAAVNEAFHTARRQLRDYAWRQRHEVKSSSGPAHGRVTRLHPEENFGFVETTDGREIYFHRHSVLEGGFERLSIGTEVRLSEEQGDEGPQASTVQIVGGAFRP